MKGIVKNIGGLVLMLALAACSGGNSSDHTSNASNGAGSNSSTSRKAKGFSGIYETADKGRYKITLEFRSDKDAIYTNMGIRSAATYSIDGNYLKLFVDRDSFIWDIQPDGSLRSDKIVLRNINDPAPVEKPKETPPPAPKLAAQPTLPEADPSTPESSYIDLKKGEQMMFEALAFSESPIKYGEIVPMLSGQLAAEYRSGDEFRKHDLEEEYKPKIDADIAEAKKQRYVRITLPFSGNVKSYDFNSKSFPVDDRVIGEGAKIFYPGFNSYGAQFSNYKSFHSIPVPDMDLARKISAARTNLKLTIYAFVQSTEKYDHTMNFQVVKIKLVDENGNVLVSR